LVPGKAFGEDRCIRMSYATSEKVIAEGLKKMADYLK
jgi:aspartate aminotransferase